MSQENASYLSFAGRRLLWNFVALGTLAVVSVAPVLGADPGELHNLESPVPSARKKGNEFPCFVAVGYALRRLTSLDGVTWTNDQADPEKGQDKNFLLRGVTYGKGRIVAVGGSETTRILVSDSAGLYWQDVSIQQNWMGDVAYGNDLFVAVGYQRSIRSQDGLKWSGPVPNRVASWRRIVFGNGRFVAIGASGTTDKAPGWCAATTDGEKWNNTKVVGDCIPRSIAYGAGRFVIVGSHGLRESSLDGIHWEQRTLGPEDELLLEIIWTGTQFVAAGNRGTYVSADGLQWQKSPLRMPSRFCYGGGSFVGCAAGKFSYSADAINWKPGSADGKMQITKIIYIDRP